MRKIHSFLIIFFLSFFYVFPINHPPQFMVPPSHKESENAKWKKIEPHRVCKKKREEINIYSNQFFFHIMEKKKKKNAARFNINNGFILFHFFG